MSKKNKIILLIVILLLITVTTIIWIQITNNKTKLVWTVLKDTVYDKTIFEDSISTSSWDLSNLNVKLKIIKEKQEQNKYDQIWSMIRNICYSFKSVKDLVNSQTFWLIKSKISYISSDVDWSSESFLYIKLPWLVFDNCNNLDDWFTNNLVKVLQGDWNSIILSTREELNWISNLVNEIIFKGDNIDKKQIQNSKEYFNKIFFENNFKELSSTYFFENMYYIWKIDKYINISTMMTFEETNVLLESSVWKLEKFVKDLWFKNLTDFRKKILAINWYSDLSWLKNDLIDNYDKLNTLSKEKFNFYLDEELLTLDSLSLFYKSGKLNKILNDNETQQIFNKIWLLHMYFTIINPDYADNLWETWSWKTLLWDTIKWNWIIRLAYLYIFEKNK